MPSQDQGFLDRVNTCWYFIISEKHFFNLTLIDINNFD